MSNADRYAARYALTAEERRAMAVKADADKLARREGRICACEAVHEMFCTAADTPHDGHDTEYVDADTAYCHKCKVDYSV